MKTIKVIIAAVLVMAGMSVMGQTTFTDNGDYSTTMDRIQLGYGGDATTFSLRANGSAFFNGQIYCTKLVPYQASGKFDFGWNSMNGANIEMYKKDNADRPGDLYMVYGGGDFGNIGFTHYNGTSWTHSLIIDKDGNVGIGINSPETKLDVDGDIKATGIYVTGKLTSEEVEVKLDVWPDYVFDEDYKLKTLNEVETFINENNHLPGVPSEKEVLENGVELGEMNKLLMEKVEELTLYVIELQKQVNELKN